MENIDYFNLPKLKEQHYKNINDFELLVKNMLYMELQNDNYFNELKEKIEFINVSLMNTCSGQKYNGKYLCRLLNFSFDGNNNFDIRITKLSNRNTIYNKYTISTIFPELDAKIKLFCKDKIFLLDEYTNIIKQKEKINNIIKYLRDNYMNNKNKLGTELYKYYYSNIDKFIKINNYQNTEYYEKFYYFISDKYKISKRDFKLDYLQHYFENNMLLLPDFEIIFDENNDILFQNSTHTLKITPLRNRRYGKFYCPQFENVCLIDKNDPLNIKKVTWNDFEKDSKLELFYINIQEYIYQITNELNNVKS
jgi:hypothetical protein